MREEYLDFGEQPIPIPKPVNKDYKVGQMIEISKKDVDGFMRNIKVKIVGVYEHFIRVEVPTRLTPYYECFLYTDLR